MITRKHIDYLRGLVRKEIRWREDMLDKFQVRDDQTPTEAEYIRNRIENLLAYDRRVLGELDKLHQRAREIDQQHEVGSLR